MASSINLGSVLKDSTMKLYGKLFYAKIMTYNTASEIYDVVTSAHVSIVWIVVLS